MSQRTGSRRTRRANLPGVPGEKQVAGVYVRSDLGNIAILDDTDGVVARRNPFNLNKRTLRFIRSEKTTEYSYELDGDTYDPVAASAGSVLSGIGDDDTRQISLPFPFPFFGQIWTSIYINSDGNASFGAGDVSITDRSLGRFTAGRPRLAPLFADLDPRYALTGIVVTSDAGRFVVSWVDVPVYSDTGTGRMQTFQMRLYPDGKIEFAWRDVTAAQAITGISNGLAEPGSTLVSFLSTPGAGYPSSIAERFTDVEQVDVFTAAQRFYLNHEDSYDYLVIFNNLGIAADQGAVAFEVTVRNSRGGVGDPRVDTGNEAGSRRRLQALLNMGPLSQYPPDPSARVPARFSVGDTPVTTLAHEAGHLFLAYASVPGDDDPDARPMLGYQGAHWAFTFNSDASLLEGNRIQDNGPGANPRFLTVATVEGYSPLDQYLMGFRPPWEVPDTFYIARPDGALTSGLPRVGVGLNGQRRDVHIDELIRAVGRRTPDHTVSQREFRFAFVLIAAAGQEPSAADLARLESYRSAFEQFYVTAASGRATATASLRSAMHISTWPASGVIAGRGATGTIRLERPATDALTVLLRTETGSIQVPESVTIPSGAMSADFQLVGLRSGTDTVTAEPVDRRFETGVFRVAVTPPGAQRLSVISGDGQIAENGVLLPQPVRVRITDANDLPYPSVHMTATASGGYVANPSATTDENGIAEFGWSPGPGSLNELSISAQDLGTVVAAALGRPSISDVGVVNAASFTPGLTPGGMATIFGASLGGADAQVLLNGSPLQIVYTSNRQINFVIPPGTSAGDVTIAIRTAAGTSDPRHATVQAVQPGIFYDASTGYGAVLISGTSNATQIQPAHRGELIEIYATGLGEVSALPDGTRTTLIRPDVVVDGLPAEVTFSGLSPASAGLYRVNARVPDGVSPGTLSLAMSAGGVMSNQVKIEVR